jgi:two-component system, NtrC family, response regulator AlgB
MRVLIIDDEANIRRLTAVALECMGHETAEAANGDSALQQLSASQFDAAFLDWRLDDEDGIELLPKLLERRPGLGVIVFTGSSTPGGEAAARRAGAAGFLMKPISPAQVEHALDSLQGSSHTQPPPG